MIPRSWNPNHIKTNLQFTHVILNEDDREYLESLDGKIIVPDYGPPFDSRSKPSVSDQETTEEEKTADKSARNGSEDIREKLVLKEEVDAKDSTLYLSSDDHWIYAFDSALGEVKWKYGTADESGSKCEFNSDGTVVYCGTDDKSLRALSAVNANIIWKFSTEGAITSSTRVGTDGSLYFGCLDGYFYALNPDGSLKWKTDLAAEIWSSPALLEGGKAVFIGSMAEDWAKVFALDGEPGEIIWKYKTAEPVSPLLPLTMITRPYFSVRAIQTVTRLILRMVTCFGCLRPTRRFSRHLLSVNWTGLSLLDPRRETFMHWIPLLENSSGLGKVCYQYSIFLK